jgi:bifunctional non-homologous end joining protein LigD
MALEKYRAKRHFDKTPEPEGKKQSSPCKLKFVVQKHHASHLHYDFRLELDGVLKSWAVPKGPSLDPAVKRLAMMVEDHPYSYMKFEGTIPAGNYGAGQVIVWDIGDYGDSHGGTQAEQEKALRYGLHKGHLAITLKGKKLKGAFDLVKIDSRGENAWLLIKKQDEYASTEDLTQLDKSAISARRLPDPEPGQSRGRSRAAKKGPAAEITRVQLPEDETPRAKARETKSKTPSKTTSKAASKAKAKSGSEFDLSQAPTIETIPYPIKPMLCTLVDKPFDSDDWVFEVKWDGYRAIGEVSGKQLRLYSRNAKSFEQQYPTVFAELPRLGHDCVVDGEVVALVSNGRSSFQNLQNYGNAPSGQTIRYAIFDLLFLDGHDLRGLPVVDRKALLEQLIRAAGSKVLVYSEHIAGAGEAYFEAAKKQGLEGIIAKKAQSAYHSTRGAEWLKIKAHMRQEAVIGGFTAPRGSRTGFGALILGVYDGIELRYIGHTGTGFTDKAIDELHARLLQLATPDCPFANKPKTNQPATWVKPQLLCEVEFTEWTQEGHMRHPSFVGMREDKPAKALHEETVKPTEALVKGSEVRASAQKGSAKATANTNEVREGGAKSAIPGIQTAAKLTSMDKLYWPEEGITKGQLLQYYYDVAEWMLPFLKNRPQSLHRFPHGVGGSSFFHKDVEYKLPPFMKTHTMHSEGHGGDITWTIANNRDSLLYLVNMGCIEINPWNSHLPKLEYADWSVIDIDPDDPNTFEEVVGIAQITRKVLDRLGIEGYPKTSGKTGLHIYIPLGAKYTHEQSKQFAHIIARMVHAQSLENTSLERMPAKRKGRIYVDFLQNRSGATLAAAYSCRPAQGATVSMPLKWSEVKKGLSPSKFTIFNTLKRLEKVGDLWSPVIGKGIKIEQVLSKFAEPLAMAAK